MAKHTLIAYYLAGTRRIFLAVSLKLFQQEYYGLLLISLSKIIAASDFFFFFVGGGGALFGMPFVKHAVYARISFK